MNEDYEGFAKHEKGRDWPEKPPIGVMPRKLWEGQRIEDLALCIHRFASHGKPIVQDWLDELTELCHRHNGRGHGHE